MTCNLEKDFEDFPKDFFLCYGDKHSMHFILSLKYLPEAQKEELVELLRHCGAEVSFNVEDATDYSAVIVDHDEVVNVIAPAFTIKYLEDCLRKMKILDFSDYRQGATRHIASDDKCTEVVYFRWLTWDSVLTEAEKKWFDGKIDSRRSLELSEPQAASNCNDDLLSSVNRRFGSCKHKDEAEREEENPKTERPNRCWVLSSDDDSDLDQPCMNKTNEKSKNIDIEIEKSRTPKAAEEKTNLRISKALDSNYSKDRTAVISGKSQNITSRSSENVTTSSTSAPSSSKRFDGKIDSRRSLELSEPQAASNCNDDLLSSVNRRFGSCKHKDEAEREEENPKTERPNRCWVLSSDDDSDLDQPCMNKTNEKSKNIDIEIEKSRTPKAAEEKTNLRISKALDSNYSKDRTAVISGKSQNITSRSSENVTTSSTSAPSSSKRPFLYAFQSESSDEDEQPQAREKKKKKNFFDFDAADEDLFRPSNDQKRSRQPYTYDEKSKILKYIVHHGEFSRVKGRELWMIMERRKICPTRTWQSMKEHFLKKIAINLEEFDFLTKSNMNDLKQALPRRK